MTFQVRSSVFGLSTFQNCSLGVVGKDQDFTIYDDQEVEPFVSLSFLGCGQRQAAQSPHKIIVGGKLWRNKSSVICLGDFSQNYHLGSLIFKLPLQILFYDHTLKYNLQPL